MPSEAVKAYTAAMIDGEGCISLSIHKGRVRLKVYVSNTNFDLLYSLRADWENRGVIYIGKPKGKWKPIGDWRLSTADALYVLAEILPYLRIKKDRAQIVLGIPKPNPYIKNVPYSSLEDEYIQNAVTKMTQLNQRGLSAVVN